MSTWPPLLTACGKRVLETYEAFLLSSLAVCESRRELCICEDLPSLLLTCSRPSANGRCRISFDEANTRYSRLRNILGRCSGTVAGYVAWRICRWHVEPPLAGTFSFRILGVLLIAVGLPVLVDSFARFAFQSLGTPAPIFPTHHLVVSGLYRYLRNLCMWGSCR